MHDPRAKTHPGLASRSGPGDSPPERASGPRTGAEFLINKMLSPIARSPTNTRSRPRHPRTNGRMAPALAPPRFDENRARRLPVDAGLRSWPPGRPAPRAAGRRGHAKPRFRMVSDPGAFVSLTPMTRVKSTRSLATFIHRFRHGRWHRSTDITNDHKPASSSMSRSLLSLRASHALPPPNPATPWSSAHQTAGRPTRTAPCFCPRLSRGEVSTDGKG